MRLGIVGAGVMGARFGASAQAMNEFSVTGVVDQQAERASALAAQLGAEPYGSIAELAGRVDAVYIGVPHDQHLASSVAAAAAGIHVLIDKPLCDTADEARAIETAVRAAGIRLMVGFSYRYRAEWVRAAQFVAEGAIGRPRLVIDTLIEAGMPTPAWYWDSAAGGGVVQLQSHHCFDRIAWVLGESFATVACQVSGEPGFAEDTAVITATTTGGVLAAIDIGFGRTYTAAPRPSTVIQGDRGHLVIDHERTITLENDEGVTVLDYSDDDWLTTELAAFAAFIDGAGDAPGVEEGGAALACALAAAESARSGGAVQTVTAIA